MASALPEWARQFVERKPGGDSRYFDSEGYALPMVNPTDGSWSLAPSSWYGSQGTYELLPGMSWGVDAEGNPLEGPRFNEDGSPILTDASGNTLGKEVPYWDKEGLLAELARQQGAGVAAPLTDLWNLYNKSELPQGGVSWDQYISTRFPGLRTTNISGLGDFLLADKEVPMDWTPYTSQDEEQSVLGTIFKEMLPVGLAMYGIGTGLGGILNPATGAAGGASTAAGGVAAPSSEFALTQAGSGTGIGGVGTAGQGLQMPGAAATGVGAGSGSLGLNLGAGGIIADTAAQLGAGAVGTGAGLLNPGATTTPTGTPPPSSPGGTSGNGAMTDAAGMPYNPNDITNPIPNTTTPTPKSFWQTLEEALGLPVNALQGATQAATSNPFLKGLGLLGDALLSNYNTNKLGDAITQAQGMADPFGPQRGFYQNMLKESYTNPNFFKDNATLGGIRNMAVNDVSRAMAAQGYNQSTNALYGIGQRLQDEGTKYALGFQNQLGQLAGAGISPQEAARLGMQGTQLANQGRQQTATSIGDLARELPNIMKGFGLT